MARSTASKMRSNEGRTSVERWRRIGHVLVTSFRYDAEYRFTGLREGGHGTGKDRPSPGEYRPDLPGVPQQGREANCGTWPAQL
jgi:hypothetical protein